MINIDAMFCTIIVISNILNVYLFINWRITTAKIKIERKKLKAYKISRSGGMVV